MIRTDYNKVLKKNNKMIPKTLEINSTSEFIIKYFKKIKTQKSGLKFKGVESKASMVYVKLQPNPSTRGTTTLKPEKIVWKITNSTKCLNEERT